MSHYDKKRPTDKKSFFKPSAPAGNRSEAPRRESFNRAPQDSFRKPFRSDRSESFAERGPRRFQSDNRYPSDRNTEDRNPFSKPFISESGSQGPRRDSFNRAPQDGFRKSFRSDRSESFSDRAPRFQRDQSDDRSFRYESPRQESSTHRASQGGGFRKPFRTNRRDSFSEGAESFTERAPRFPSNRYHADRRPAPRPFIRTESSESSFGHESSDRESFSDRPQGGFRRSYRPERSERSGSFSSSRRGSNHRGAGKNVSKFNPSQFIKKVEEQVQTPVYVPKHKFSDFLIEEQLKKNIIKRGYISPTPIQDQAIPLLLEGKDVVGTANTGTGKTAAFLIPLVNRLLTKKTERVLIITPTRELAAQIQTELNVFKENTGFKSTLCIGGLNINPQISQLRHDPEFVIGTPGRLKDLENNRFLDFSRYTSIVLDEVDTMLDMGFINDMKYIIAKLPEERHSLFFSATISSQIKDIITRFLNNPTHISVKTRQSAENVNQDIVKTGNKIETLHELLIKPEFTKVIVFVRTKHATDKLSRNLNERGFKTTTIHGNKSQQQRKKALDMFKSNAIKILLATDIVARGIDIDDVSHVINFDMPKTHEDYIHRIGRTGRANKIGQALTFIDGQ